MSLRPRRSRSQSPGKLAAPPARAARHDAQADSGQADVEQIVLSWSTEQPTVDSCASAAQTEAHFAPISQSEEQPATDSCAGATQMEALFAPISISQNEERQQQLQQSSPAAVAPVVAAPEKQRGIHATVSAIVDEDFFARLWHDVEGPPCLRNEARPSRSRSRADSPASRRCAREADSLAPASHRCTVDDDEEEDDVPVAELSMLAVLNHATSLEDLRILRGIGPKSAAAIMEHRKKGGRPLKRVEELVTVVGLRRPQVRQLLAANA